MNKNKTKTVLISVAIIIFLIAFSFFIRAQAADLSAYPVEQRSIFIDSDGLPYFSEMDSYYNLRLTQDYLDHGFFGDVMLNKTTENSVLTNQTPLIYSSAEENTPWDLHRMTPYGVSAEYPPAIIYVTAFLYSIANQFIGDFSLKEVAFYTTTIISSLAVIPAFILLRRVTNTYGAVAGTLIILFAPNYLTHTYAGFFDTDMFNVVLPLFIFLFFIEGIRNERLIFRIIFILLSAISLGLFSYAWTGYMFYPAVLVLAILLFFILGFILKMDLIKPRKDYSNILSWFINQKEIFSTLLFVIFSLGILYFIVGSFESILNSVLNLIGATQLQSTINVVDIYPNVAISIGELQKVPLVVGGIIGAFGSNNGALVNGVGGVVAFFGALFLLILYILRSIISKPKILNDKKPSKNIRTIRTRNKSGGFELQSLFPYIDNINYEDTTKTRREGLLYATVFGVWAIVALLAVTQGSRFLQILMIPMGVFTGLFVGFAVKYVKAKINNNNVLFALSVGCGLLIALPMSQIDFPIPQTIMASTTLTEIVSFLVVVAIGAILIYGKEYLDFANFSLNKKQAYVALIIFLAVSLPTVATAYYTTGHTGPGTSDFMWNAMTYVNENSTNDTAMASWWDFGYLFEIAADRSAIFDGGGQTGQRAHWIGKAIYTNNSDLSAGILEMVATSGDDGYNKLDEYTNDTAKTVEILDKVLPMSKDEAISTMTSEYNLTSQQANTIANLSHPSNPRPVIFVMSSDMVGKSYWWSYFGSWDFKAKKSTGFNYMSNEQPVQMVTNGNLSQALIVNSAEPYATVVTNVTKNPNVNNSTNATVTVLNPLTNQTLLDQNGTVYNPFSIHDRIIIEDGYLAKNETLNKSGEYSLLVIGSGDQYISYLMNKELLNSMFTKLYILQGFGQDRFELIPVPKETQGIFLWKVIPRSGSSSTNSTS